ncbi:hypothetical protein [Desulfosporosinus youngiae]|uniref:hypothetical protein n=1 Tax=Desulfosporosinus youngiae TaxID=339862 RepID=UPI00145D8281|nr:hypothetical protein [Desulfosporosinus youngiae]
MQIVILDPKNHDEAERVYTAEKSVCEFGLAIDLLVACGYSSSASYTGAVSLQA